MDGETSKGSKKAKLTKKNKGFIDQSSDNEGQESLNILTLPDSSEESSVKVEEELILLAGNESDLLNISAGFLKMFRHSDLWMKKMKKMLLVLRMGKSEEKAWSGFWFLSLKLQLMQRTL